MRVELSEKEGMNTWNHLFTLYRADMIYPCG
jgi:hypothetical protein